MASLVANGVSMLIARLLVPMFSFAINVGIARVLGVQALGVYVHLMAVLIIVQSMAAAGIAQLLTRELAAHPENTKERLIQARSFAFGSGILTTLVFLLYSWAFLPPERLRLAAILAVCVMPSAWIAIQEAFFMATRRHHWLTALAFAENALKLGFAAVVFLTDGGVVGLCVGIAISRVIAFGLGEWLLRRAGVVGTWSLRLGEVAPFAKSIVPFAASFVLAMVYFRIDVLLIHAMLGENQTGVYGAALALYSVVLLLPTSAMSALYPRLSVAFRASSDGFARATFLSSWLVVAGVVPFAIFLILFADVVLLTLYGTMFGASVLILRVLACSLPMHAVNGVLGQALQAGQLQNRALHIVLTGLSVHVVATLFLLPRMGTIGAAIAVLISSSAVTLAVTLAFYPLVRRLQFDRYSLLALSSVIGPVALAFVTPPVWRFLGAGLGMLWLVFGSSVALVRRNELPYIRRTLRLGSLTAR